MSKQLKQVYDKDGIQEYERILTAETVSNPQHQSEDRVAITELIAEMRHQRDTARAEIEQLKRKNSELLLRISELTIKLTKAGSQPQPKPDHKEDDIQRDIERFQSWLRHR